MIGCAHAEPGGLLPHAHASALTASKQNDHDHVSIYAQNEAACGNALA